jgi:antitoxin component HigA of HigAB toxin-antitoxin module
MLAMKGMKQQDLVPILGTKSFVSKILNGVAQLPIDAIDPLSRALGISPAALIPKKAESKRTMRA